ncbi:MAG: T9SS C-terminal target domain-containing protein [Cytophagales bacterium]|nr:MAG: T9SS C-terminal target domain-containing protein [Cytophagales bacterium]
MYPNPSSSSFTVKGGKSVTVFDLLGKVILSTSETTFTISAKGIFIAQVETENGVKFVKLVVE